jgi:hypothetical protein
MFFETYLASEGFVAFQARKEAEGMRLNFRNGMFFEFVPFNEQNFYENGNIKSNAVALNIGQVELNKNYAILLTTCSGAWRYLIGDTIKFVNLDFVIKLLCEKELKCFYCREPVYLFYNFVRENKQWTLERIDNSAGHNRDNVEVACLLCNLRRRTMYHERYVFTKQMNVVKLDSGENSYILGERK